MRYKILLAVLLTAMVIFSVSVAVVIEPNPNLADHDAATFAKVALEVSKINAAIKAKGGTWTAGATSVSFLNETSRKRLLGLQQPAPESYEVYTELGGAPLSAAAKIDWRNNNGSWVTSVKNQGDCGSCVAFATTSTEESTMMIAAKSSTPKPDLSEAFLFFGGGGSCTNGWQFERALARERDVGAVPEACWPYDGTGPCSDWKTKVVKINSYSTTKDPKGYLTTYGPLMAGMEVYSDFFDYTGGVYEPVYGDFAGNHAIAVVGYSDEKGAWLVKNSWSTAWGESGYVWIKYGTCGIGSSFPFYTMSMSGGPTPPTPPVPVNNIISPYDGTYKVMKVSGPLVGALMANGLKVADVSSMPKYLSIPISGSFKKGDALNFTEVYQGKVYLTTKVSGFGFSSWYVTENVGAGNELFLVSETKSKPKLPASLVQLEAKMLPGQLLVPWS